MSYTLFLTICTLPMFETPTKQTLNLLPTPYSLRPKTNKFIPHPIDKCYKMLSFRCS
ncbi:hypothetical protein [Moorena sp. SIOASIH]|uniref:hypothetical protein n=1 Tax=Moorena sp. SIOASIH TaxID=2607817 RepID=UPI0025E2F803|nr:hypothetical protein [Moorena sp. SIOASIH]